MSDIPAPIEPRLLRLRKRRARALMLSEGADFLFRQASVDLIERLEAIARSFERVLVLGGQGALQGALAQRPDLFARIGHVVSAEVSGGAVEIDLEALPFADESFDLVVSPITLHWANDLAGAFIQIRRMLKPDGLMLASLLGGDTLSELRLSLLQAESELRGGAALRVAPFAQLDDVAALLQRAGLALPTADRDVTSVRYRDPLRLMLDLRAMGESAALKDINPLRRDVMFRALEIYAEKYAEPDGRVRATFEILTATGWAPHESQQKPLKPGSARTRLAEALGVAEKSAGERAKS